MTQFACLPSRMGALERWARQQLPDLQHAHRVRCTATALFDLTFSRHQLEPEWRQLLDAAALVHNIGRSVSLDHYPLHGTRMVLEATSLPMSEAERRALAFLILYHRDGVPHWGEEAILEPSDDRRVLRTLLALLRAADALDSSSQEPPRIVFALGGDVLSIVCYVDARRYKIERLYQRRKKMRLLHEMLGLRVELEVRAVDSCSLVA